MFEILACFLEDRLMVIDPPPNNRARTGEGVA
jgi:hypothetical protein